MTDLTLPSESTQYKDDIQTFARAANVALFPLWIKALRDSGKVEDLRKAIEFLTSITAAAIEKKVDPNANLPMFNITFVSGNVQATAVELVEEITHAPPAPAPKVVSTEAELVHELEVQLGKPPEVTPADLAALRAELDDMLKDII